MNGNDDQDIHNRHSVQASPAASTAAEGSTMANNNDNKPQEVKTTQKVRNAHYQEDGVRADGTLPAPKSEDEGEE